MAGRLIKSLCAAMLLALCLGGNALAQEARDLTAECSFKGSNAPAETRRLRDRNYKSKWTAQTGASGKLQVTLPEGETCGGIYFKWYEHARACQIQVEQEGQWVPVAETPGDFLAEYVALPEGITSFRVRMAPGTTGTLMLAEIYVFGQGDTPLWVQQWNPPHEDADLLLISAHPDDEILFMGGTIPYYAGEMGKKVQVAYVTRSMPYRRLELLDGLWLCGVRHYPDIGFQRDTFSTSLKVMYQRWYKPTIYRIFSELYRKYRPEVVVTHDIQGEYGHGAHKVSADASIQALTLAADPEYDAESAQTFGTWDVPKLYLHLYGENVVDMDWRKPLEAFDGRTAFDMAEAAFQCHTSQLETEYKVEDFGPYDNSLFGLYRSQVGQDTGLNDFFENIP